MHLEATPLLDVKDVAALFARFAPPLDIDQANAAAAQVDRLGFAFALGYAAALHRLVPAVTSLCALAATESRIEPGTTKVKGSTHPRDLKTTIADDDTITGEKAFVTFGSLADEILVIAREPLDREDGRPQLRAAIVSARDPGVTLVPAAFQTPFAPEIPHGKVTFDHARSKRLAGDGYDLYLKPFRTVEDICVHNTLIAFLLGMGLRDGWPDAWILRARAALARIRSLVHEDPSAPSTHLSLGDAIEEARALLSGLAWTAARAAERTMWERDQPLLLVAERARTERLLAARARLPSRARG